MNEHYNLKNAMKLLGITSINAFHQLERKYPEAFVNLRPFNPYKYQRNGAWYDKAKLDNFARVCMQNTK